MSQKKVSIITGLLVSMMFIISFSFFLIVYQNRDNKSLYYPSAATAEEIEEAKKLPIEKCSCWDGTQSVCLPQASCI